MDVEYVVEDDRHCEVIASFATEEAALDAIRRFAELAWDEEPNRAPCMSWRTCGRLYLIAAPSGSRREVLDISSAGTVWLDATA